MRAAVRWRMPVSLVESEGSGLRWKLARRILLSPPSMTIAPSILESSKSRLLVKEMFSGKPSLPAASTASVSPTQMSAPMWPAMIISRAVLSGCPGAVRRTASFMRSSVLFCSTADLPCFSLVLLSHESQGPLQICRKVTMPPRLRNGGVKQTRLTAGPDEPTAKRPAGNQSDWPLKARNFT